MTSNLHFQMFMEKNIHMLILEALKEQETYKKKIEKIPSEINNCDEIGKYIPKITMTSTSCMRRNVDIIVRHLQNLECGMECIYQYSKKGKHHYLCHICDLYFSTIQPFLQECKAKKTTAIPVDMENSIINFVDFLKESKDILIDYFDASFFKILLPSTHKIYSITCALRYRYIPIGQISFSLKYIQSSDSYMYSKGTTYFFEIEKMIKKIKKRDLQRILHSA